MRFSIATTKLFSAGLVMSLVLLLVPQTSSAQQWQCSCGSSAPGSPQGAPFYSSQSDCQSSCPSRCNTSQPWCAQLASTTTPPPPGSSTTLRNPIGAVNIPILIGSIIKKALGVVGSIALLMFVYGGFIWMTAGGAADKVKKGRDIFVWASIGLAVIFSSYAILTTVFDLLT